MVGKTKAMEVVITETIAIITRYVAPVTTAVVAVTAGTESIIINHVATAIASAVKLYLPNILIQVFFLKYKVSIITIIVG